jgi:hypothetical protein
VSALPQATLPRGQDQPRSGDSALTPARQSYPQGAHGWLAFWKVVRELYAYAHDHSRTYLDYDEWNKFFRAAIRYGCVDRSELSGEIMPLEHYTAANPLSNRRLGSLLHAALVEQFRQVRERKAAGDSPYQLAAWQRDRCANYSAQQREREQHEAHARTSSVTSMTLHDRKRRRSKPDDDDDT